MANAAKIDIQGVQWELKDQNARDRIAALEEKTIIKVTRKVNEVAFKMNLVEINGEKFIQIYANGINWNEEESYIIANYTNDFELNRTIRVIMSGFDNTLAERFVCRIDIEPEGNIRVRPSTVNNGGSKYTNSKIFGDIFVKINY